MQKKLRPRTWLAIPDKVPDQDEGIPDMLKSNTLFSHVPTYAKQYISAFIMCKQRASFDHHYHQ